MDESTALSQRIKAEFEARTQRRKSAEQQAASESQEREKRLALFTKTCEDLKGIWGPRLQEFAKQFGDKIKVTPTLSPAQREAKLAFLTELASITLTLTASPSADVSKLVLDYELLIIPIFFEYERHARLEMPLDKIDRDAVGKWVDDRLISCLKAYLSIQDNEFYVKRAMVEDPITKATFLREDAKAKLDLGGKTYYFSSEESFRRFKEENAPKAPEPKQETPANVGKAPAPAKPAATPMPEGPGQPVVVARPASGAKPEVTAKPAAPAKPR